MVDEAARTPSPAPANDMALLFYHLDVLLGPAPRHSGVYLPDSPLSSSTLSDDLANQPLSLFNNPAHNGSFACALAAKAAPLKKVQEAPEVSKVQEGGAHPIPTRVQQHRWPPLKLAQKTTTACTCGRNTPGGGGGWLHISNDSKPAGEPTANILLKQKATPANYLATTLSRSKPAPVPAAQSPSSTPIPHVVFIVQTPANTPAAPSSAPGPAVPVPTAPPAEPTTPPSAPSGEPNHEMSMELVREAGGGGGMPRDVPSTARKQRGAGGRRWRQRAMLRAEHGAQKDGEVGGWEVWEAGRAEHGARCGRREAEMPRDVPRMGAFPPAYQPVASILDNDTSAQQKFLAMKAGIPNIAPRGTLDGNFTQARAAYDPADPYCWWMYGQCVTPKLSGLKPDVASVLEPRTLGYGFDDGPNCSHNAFYDYSTEQNQKATMFYIGSNVITFPLEAKRAIVDGHEVCVYTWSHPAMTATTNEGAFAELWYTMQAIKLVTGFTPTCWRPPYGDVDDRIRYIAAQLGLETILWKYDSNDWAEADGVPAATVQANYDWLMANVTAGTFDSIGAIILTHELNNFTMQMAIDNHPKLAAAFDVRPPFTQSYPILC
ncbi:hypothetical protein FB451DRAFT_1365459 [Mycena latifolia]|nr:hypothetical protein FB451DRAFT_1365459 [Mycena latifolia]